MNCPAILGRTHFRAVYLKRMVWLMPNINRAVSYLGYLAMAGTKPAGAADGAPS